MPILLQAELCVCYFKKFNRNVTNDYLYRENNIRVILYGLTVNEPGKYESANYAGKSLNGQ